MKIIKPVTVKQVVTEKSKKALAHAFEKEIAQLDLECQQLLFEKRKLINKLTGSRNSIEQRFTNEIKRRKDKMVLLEFKIEQLELLKINSEIIEKEVEAFVEVEVGADWSKINSKQSIVVKDGTIIRIDNE